MRSIGSVAVIASEIVRERVQPGELVLPVGLALCMVGLGLYFYRRRP